MKTIRLRSRRSAQQRRQPLWLRVVAFFAMALIGAASTAQLCHSHDDTLPVKSFAMAKSAVGIANEASKDSGPTKSDQDRDGSAVRCPLCVAMHSALPVTGHLPQVALLALVAVVPAAGDRGRRFSWRFEMASRPPPPSRSLV